MTRIILGGVAIAAALGVLIGCSDSPAEVREAAEARAARYAAMAAEIQVGLPAGCTASVIYRERYVDLVMIRCPEGIAVLKQ